MVAMQQALIGDVADARDLLAEIELQEYWDRVFAGTADPPEPADSISFALLAVAMIERDDREGAADGWYTALESAPERVHFAGGVLTVVGLGRQAAMVERREEARLGTCD